MANPTVGSIMLASTDPERLHAWYTHALPPDSDDPMGDYHVVGYSGVYLFFDKRDDIGQANAEPGRMFLNMMVDDAKAVAARIDERGAEWHAPIEDRDGSLFATAVDPDGNYVQIIELSEKAKAEMAGTSETASA